MGGGGGMEVVEEGDDIPIAYTVTTRMTSALRWAAMRAILMFQQEVMDKVTRQLPQTTTFLSHKTASTNHNLSKEGVVFQTDDIYIYIYIYIYMIYIYIYACQWAPSGLKWRKGRRSQGMVTLEGRKGWIRLPLPLLWLVGFGCIVDDDDELMLNVLRCQLTY